MLPPPPQQSEVVLSTEEEIIEGSSEDEQSDHNVLNTTSEASDSEDDGVRNMVGNIPLEWYGEHDHIGYTKDGKPIPRPAKPDAVQQFLDLQTGKGLRTVWDDLHHESVEFTPQQMEVVKNIQSARFPHSSFNAFPDYIPYFSSAKLTMPIKQGPPSKTAFIPSRGDAKKVLRYVKAIQQGVFHTPSNTSSNEPYLLWDDSGHVIGDVSKRSQYIPPPKPSPPSHYESYHPPQEYIPTEEELSQWAMLDLEKRPISFIPRQYSALRLVPYYQPLVEESFERCMDMYLCPRTYKKKQIDPSTLLPKLPPTKDLRPFPTRVLVEIDCEDGVKAVDCDFDGIYAAVGLSNGRVFIIEISTGRVVGKISFSFVQGAINDLKWVNQCNSNLLSICCGNFVIVLDLALSISNSNLPCVESSLEHSTWRILTTNDYDVTKSDLIRSGICIKHHNEEPIESIDSHSKGDYLVAVSNSCLLIHRLSKSQSIRPFKSLGSRIVNCRFHPIKPLLFLATCSSVRIFDLIGSNQSRKLLPGSNTISNMAIHSSGNHLIVSTNDRKVIWFDLDFGSKPFKILSYHSKAAKVVDFNVKFPLFASGSADGNVHVFYGKVFDNLYENPLIVPVKILRSNSIVRSINFINNQPWIVVGYADGNVKVYVP
ncbi:hypothetical protein P9112_012905 [Eukaryota sp. TZLM1-RC]